MDIKSILVFVLLVIVYSSCSYDNSNDIKEDIEPKKDSLAINHTTLKDADKSPFLYPLNESASHTEIDEYIERINKEVKDDRLNLIIYSNKSYCGGYLRGYYYRNRLVYLYGVNGGELGGASIKKMYFKKNEIYFISSFYEYADFERYEKENPNDSIIDIKKMNYQTGGEKYKFGKEPMYEEYRNGKITSTEFDTVSLNHLLKCAEKMDLELKEEIRRMNTQE